MLQFLCRIVRDILLAESYVNSKFEYKEIADFFNPGTNQFETLVVIIGFTYYKYPVDSCALCKYYQCDINIENMVSVNELLGDINKYFVSSKY